MSPGTILRANPSQLDDSWNFQVSMSAATKRGMGKHLSFTPKAITFQMSLFPTNRILDGDDTSKFVLASFGELRFPDTGPSVARDYMIRFFSAGLSLNGVQYRFYGHSNSQLACIYVLCLVLILGNDVYQRGRSCFLREAKTDAELDRRISQLGEFGKIMNVAKRESNICGGSVYLSTTA